MAETSSGTSHVAAVIGDVVRSRKVPDRRALHDRLSDALALVSSRTTPVLPMRITVGDEFQGCYARLGEAIEAALLMRLELLPEFDTRYGIGWGTITQLDQQTQDGPAWWAARDAIEWVAKAAEQPETRNARTAYRTTEPAAVAPEAVNAALLCRDQLVGSWDERSYRLIKGLLSGRTQAELAASEGISRPGVSERIRNQGLGTVIKASEWLRVLP
jgi:hypothetical protein